MGIDSSSSPRKENPTEQQGTPPAEVSGGEGAVYNETPLPSSTDSTLFAALAHGKQFGSDGSKRNFQDPIEAFYE